METTEGLTLITTSTTVGSTGCGAGGEVDTVLDGGAGDGTLDWVFAGGVRDGISTETLLAVDVCV
jgi:hypothetical protein